MVNTADENKGKVLGTAQPLYIVVSFVLIIVVVFSVLAAVTFGSASISIKEVYSVIMYKLFKSDNLLAFAQGPIHDIVWLIRLPRILLAITVGSGLSMCGIVMQAIVKNPLADPYIMGISSGASFGATLAVLLGVGAAFGSNYVGVVAFMGAFTVSIVVVTVANIGGRANSIKLLLTGHAISMVCSSLSSVIVYFANNREGMQTVTFWLMGSLGSARWERLPAVYIVVVSGIFFFMTQSRTLNLMLLGDEAAVTLGKELHRWRQLYLLVSSLLVGYIVFSAGMIGFVGLLIPHFVRMFFGTDHRKLIPVAVLVGANFVIWADVLSRTMFCRTKCMTVPRSAAVAGAWFTVVKSGVFGLYGNSSDRCELSPLTALTGSLEGTNAAPANG